MRLLFAWQPLGAVVRGFASGTAQNRRHPHRANLCSFISEVLNVQPTTSTVLAFDPPYHSSAAGAGPGWSRDDSLRLSLTVSGIDCRNPDLDCAAHPELRRSDLPGPGWAHWDFWA